MILLYSVFVRQRLLDAPFKQYAVELMYFFGMSLYMITRCLILELNIYSEEERAKASPLTSSIVAGIVVTAISGVLNYTQHAEQHRKDGIGYSIAMLAMTLISSTVLTYAVLSSLKYLNAKKQAKIQEWLDEKELDE